MNGYIKAVDSNQFIQNTSSVKKETFTLKVRWYLSWILKVKQCVPKSLS